MSIAANILIIVFEAVAFLGVPKGRKLVKTLAFYTQISNYIALISSVLFLFLNVHAAIFRYLTTCMLTMTFLVTLLVLVPMGGDFKQLMLGRTGLYHHLLCPVLSFVSYVFWEPHAHAWYLPAAVTLVYGIIMIYLNAVKKFDGPYPFFWVHHQSIFATVVWMVVLLFVVSAISFGISVLAA